MKACAVLAAIGRAGRKVYQPSSFPSHELRSMCLAAGRAGSVPAAGTLGRAFAAERSRLGRSARRTPARRLVAASHAEQPAPAAQPAPTAERRTG